MTQGSMTNRDGSGIRVSLFFTQTLVTLKYHLCRFAAAMHLTQANQFAPDALYRWPNHSYQTYSTIPSNSHNPPTLLPPSAHHVQFYSQPIIPSQPMEQVPSTQSSLVAGRLGQHGPYPSGQAPQRQPFHPPPSDPRAVTLAASATSYDTPSEASNPRRSSMCVHRTVESRTLPAHVMAPYARAMPSLSRRYDRQSTTMTEPTIKRKRRRAGAPCLLIN